MRFRVFDFVLGITIVIATIIINMGHLSTVAASTIGLGLDWKRNVFLQEFWKNDQPYYLIVNLTNTAITVNVRPWHPPDKFGARLATWDVRPISYSVVDATVVRGKPLIEFSLSNGVHLGFLEAPRLADESKSESIRTYLGLNGAGSRNVDVWLEHDSLVLEGETTLRMQLIVRDGVGTVIFKQSLDTEYSPAVLLKNATSETLPISSDGVKVVIDARESTANRGLHRVYLEFEVGACSAPTLVVITGWLRKSSSHGYSITRGVVCKPSSR